MCCQPGGDPLCSVSLVPISISNSDDSEALRSHAQSEAPYSLPLIASAWRGSPVLSAWRGSPALCPLVPISISNSDDSEALGSHAQSEVPYSLPLIL